MTRAGRAKRLGYNPGIVSNNKDSRDVPELDSVERHRGRPFGALVRLTPQRSRSPSAWLALLASVSAASIIIVGALSPGRPPRLLLAVLLIAAIAQIAIAAVACGRPSVRNLVVAGLGHGLMAVMLWITLVVGLFDGTSTWRPEVTSVPDYYALGLNIIAANCFLTIAVRAWSAPSRRLRALRTALTLVLPITVLAWAVAHIRLTQIIAAILVLAGGVPESLMRIFAPVCIILFCAAIAGFSNTNIRRATGISVLGTLSMLPALLVLTFMSWGGWNSAIHSAWFSNATSLRARPGQTTTVAYCWPRGSPLAMDISQPLAKESSAPAVVYFHGGETLLGTRALDDGGPDAPYFIRLRDSLVSHGFVFAAVDYRLAPLHHIPDEIEDAKCAVEFLRSNSQTLRIDPNRIGVFGPSQGGYISSMLGLPGSIAGRNGEEPIGNFHQVQAVVDMWGPADLSNFSGSPSWVAAIAGTGRDPSAKMLAALRDASPLYHVMAGAPPFLIIQGDDDWFIAPHHSRDLYDGLRQVGADVTLVAVRHNGHGLAAPTGSFDQEDPRPDKLIETVEEFFVRTLRPTDTPNAVL
jgi:acetyl esterase/lipase